MNKTTATFAPGVPAPPAWLDAAAKREYKRVSRLIKAADEGYLQQVDMAALATYAQAYSDIARLTKEIRNEGGESVVSDKGNLYQNPRVGALGSAYSRMEKAASRLGFAPADRAKFQVEVKPKGKSKIEALRAG